MIENGKTAFKVGATAGEADLTRLEVETMRWIRLG